MTQFKKRQEKVFVCYMDTGEPLKKRDGSGPIVVREVDAVKWCNRKGWKVRGRPIFLSVAIVKMRRIVGTNLQTVRYMEPDE